MAWRKLGRIYAVDGRRDWAQSHASVPIADHCGGDRFRVYFTSRDSRNRSHVGWFEVDLEDPAALLAEAEAPVLAPGRLGAFDEDGTMASALVRHGGRRLLYYIGWNRGVTVPFRNSIGLAVQTEDGGPFQRHGEGPVVDRSPADPYFVASHDVVVEGATWHMWYLSGLDWRPGEPPQSTYNLRYAISADGIDWRRHGTVAVDFAHPGEIAIARPTVRRDGAVWRMWYCYRGTGFTYRIGYAESDDAVRWTRRDDRAGIAASAEGWDSEMICYPHVFDHRGRRYMLYNGNGYGASGIGLAIAEPDGGEDGQ